ncbi:MAG: hypothetical protein JKY37_25310 [Nannocystaceae bacterium]|nr:hypothetical protein [Nannocystaceae bacterium]
MSNVRARRRPRKRHVRRVLGQSHPTTADSTADDTADDTGSDDDRDSGSTGESEDDSTADSGTDGPPPAGDGPGPSQDPRPDADAPGAYVCDGCPEAMTDVDDFAAGATSTYEVQGSAAGHDGPGQFFVLASDGRFTGGLLPTDDNTGAFSREVPLFCGEILVKILLSNDAGTTAYVRAVLHTECVASDVRVTATWDTTVQDWGLHLVRFGGSLGVHDSDCSVENWCTGQEPDWGVDGNPNDNPEMDIETKGEFAGLSNIRYAGAEDGLTVFIENYDVDGGLTPAGTVYINVLGLPTQVLQVDMLAYQQLLTVAAVDGEAGAVEWVNELFDCSGDWVDNRCGADVP